MDKHYIDTEVDRRCLTVEHIDTGAWDGPQPTMIRLSEEEVYPGWSAVLSVAEARKLAEFLTAAADAAEDRNWDYATESADA